MRSPCDLWHRSDSVLLRALLGIILLIVFPALCAGAPTFPPVDLTLLAYDRLDQPSEQLSFGMILDEPLAAFAAGCTLVFAGVHS